MSDKHDDNTEDAARELSKFLSPKASAPRASRKSPHVEVIRGGAGLAELMSALLGGPAGRPDGNESEHPLLKALRDRESETPRGPTPSSKEEVLRFLSGIEKFKVGDIVKLREDFKALDRWPSIDQECVVTQVLKTPYRSGDAGSVQIASQLDIALMFTMPSDSALDEAFGINEPGAATAEFLYDSRRFTKIGSIFD